jgi:Ser/Thr protein kinase RdoA (MazF antagonist)
VAVVHGDPGPGNTRVTADGRIGLLDFDESRVDVCSHDLANLGVVVLDRPRHARAQLLSDAWETVNAWRTEPAYARRRLGALLARLDG